MGVRTANGNRGGLVVWLLISLLIAACGLIGTGLLLYRHATSELPGIDELKDYPFTLITEVYADDGTLIGEFFDHSQNR